MNTTRDDDRTISIDCEWFRKILAMRMRELAADRCRGMLLARMQGSRAEQIPLSSRTFPEGKYDNGLLD